LEILLLIQFILFITDFKRKKKESQGEKGELKQEINPEDLPKVQFQVQVFFTQLDGRRMMRVFTTNLEVTKNRKIAEENVNLPVIGLSSAQKSAEYAHQGDYTRAQLHNRANQRLMFRNLKSESDSHYYGRWMLNNENMDSEIRSVTHLEKESMVDKEKMIKPIQCERRRIDRKQNDNLSNILYYNKRGKDYMRDHQRPTIHPSSEDTNDRDEEPQLNSPPLLERKEKGTSRPLRRFKRFSGDEQMLDDEEKNEENDLE